MEVVPLEEIAAGVLAGMGMSLAAMGAAAAGLLPAVWGAVLQEAIDVAVILNALRALVPAAPEVRLTAADTGLTRRFRAERRAIGRTSTGCGRSRRPLPSPARWPGPAARANCSPARYGRTSTRRSQTCTLR